MDKLIAKNYILNNRKFYREIGGKKMEFSYWLLSNSDGYYKITKTLKQMSEESEISLSTVKQTVKFLIEKGLLIRINMGCYQLTVPSTDTANEVK